jgi:acyl-CoA thioesterase FadM
VYVVVRIEMDLVRELPVDQREATVTVEVQRIGRTSVVLDESLLDADSNTIARSRTTIVRWDKESRMPREVSLQERAVLEPYIGGTSPA